MTTADRETRFLHSLTARGFCVTRVRPRKGRCGPDLCGQSSAGAECYDVTTHNPHRSARARPRVPAPCFVAAVDAEGRVQLFDMTGDPHPDFRDLESRHTLAAAADALVPELARQAARKYFAALLAAQERRP